jgi:hypothetical protein
MTSNRDLRTRLAAGNNADLYAAMFSAHGLAFCLTDHAFGAADRPPPYYSHLIVLAPDAGDAILAEFKALAVRHEERLGLKDGFCSLDLKRAGFKTLFKAQWIWKAAQTTCRSEWTRIDNPEALIQWEAAWQSRSPAPQRLFPPALLDRRDIALFARPEGTVFAAGCIANLSDECVGVSNVFGDAPDIFSEAAKAAQSFASPLPRGCP